MDEIYEASRVFRVEDDSLRKNIGIKKSYSNTRFFKQKVCT